ncbi:hypothetical protein [Streptomyces sp. NPDC087437]|uniref:hypothetical protein n=1 Tax=Streptomyces sp. NPDC087437 TaxID=3365789 RepID=UPI00382F32A3
MRYMVEAFAVGSLRRGAGIEQFLGPKDHNGERGVAWVEIWPREQGYVITLYGGADRADGYQGQRNLYELPPFLYPHEDDEDMPFCELGITSEPLGALELAESLTGAVRSRWMNRGLRHGRVRRLRTSGQPKRVARQLGPTPHAPVPPAKTPVLTASS